MALQDLTPQLRTRLSRMEKAVGWFVLLAIALLAFGFVYYVYTTAERKGWFLTKAPYFTFVNSASGLKVGDPVMMMGFEAGRITEIDPMPGDQFVYNVYVAFELKHPNYDYIWTEGSEARIATADFLGKRVLEVTKGVGGYPTFVRFPLRELPVDEVQRLPDIEDWQYAQEIAEPDGTNALARPREPLTNLDALKRAGINRVTVMNVKQKKKGLTGMWNFQMSRYEPFTNNVSKYWLLVEESPAVTERLEQLVQQVEGALPGVFALTNQLGSVLANGSDLVATLNVLASNATPAISNLSSATAQLDRPGGLGEWLLPTNLNARLESTMGSAGAAMDSANTNLSLLVSNLSVSLNNLASITSNLNNQVEANTNLVSGISKAIIDADDLIQGLKRHWLLRSAFKKPKPTPEQGTNAPPRSTKLRSPKASSLR